MKNRRIIIAIISIAVSVILGIFLFNHPDFIKVMTSDSVEIASTPAHNFIKNTVISVACGGSIYAIFYSIPNEYKKANQKKEDE